MKFTEYKKLPDTPGVYIMKGADGMILYVGKAGNLRRRVSSYFERPHLRQSFGGQAHDVRIEKLVDKIAAIDYQQTDTALEALILEAKLIRKFTPPFNVKEKDDKSFLYVEITKEKFPRVILARGHDFAKGYVGHGHDASDGKRYGPFTSASSAREALKILRKIFPWNTHDPDRIGTFIRPCFDYEIGLCPGTCIGAISRGDYMKNIERLKLFFEGKKKVVLRSIEKEMAAASKKMEFEKAVKLRHQMFALKHIQDTALISDPEIFTPRLSPLAPYFRIEGYDISNISGTSAVGSMVVFSARGGLASGWENFEPNKNEYRKFKIRTIFQPNDVGMLTEVLERRFKHSSISAPVPLVLSPWPLPNLILIDGGLAQTNAARKVLLRAGLRIPVVGIAKGSERKRNDFIGLVPKGVDKATLIRVRNEAHRFAIAYHKKLRGARSMN
jgi:excinuclease ABC subunit C